MLSRMLSPAMAEKDGRGPITDVDGAYVRALRESLGLSHMDLASKIGVEKGTVVRWEKKAISNVTWVGVLVSLGLETTWAPSPKQLADARADLARLKPAK